MAKIYNDKGTILFETPLKRQVFIAEIFFLKFIFNLSVKLYLCNPKTRENKLKWPVRLGVRTLDFHSRNRGSIPLRATEGDSSPNVRGLFFKEQPFFFSFQ